jgi:hypothetical protein
LKILFLLAFGGGLAIAVYTMLHGVEKKRGDAISRPAAHLNLPALAALMVVFGAVGYLLIRNSALGSGTIAAISAAAGVAGWFGMTLLMAKWALRPDDGNAHDEAEEIQGQLARVLTPIRANALGSIRYERNGKQHDAPARGLNDSEIPSDADVVIDRFDDGIAVVEDWASVEQRL